MQCQQEITHGTPRRCTQKDTSSSEGSSSVYTDEKYVHTSDSTLKCWKDPSVGLKIPFSKDERRENDCSACWVRWRVRSRDRTANQATGDYHGEINHQTILGRLNKQLIPNLSPRSVIVMDKAAYQNMQTDHVPVMSNTPAKIQEWLSQHEIRYRQNMIKVELVALIKKYRQQPVYVLDQSSERHGQLAPRLPPYHDDLNPIELILGNLKGYIARRNLAFNLTKIKELFQWGAWPASQSSTGEIVSSMSRG